MFGIQDKLHIVDSLDWLEGTNTLFTCASDSEEAKVDKKNLSKYSKKMRKAI